MAFVACAAFYTLGLLMVHRIQTRATGNLGRGSNVVSSMATAFGFVVRHPYLRALFAVVAFHCAMTMSFEALFPAVSFNVLDAGREGVSYLMMGVGAGGLVSSIMIAGIRQDAWRGRMLLVTGVISGLSMLGLAAAISLPMAVISAGFMGASQAAFMALLTSKVQLLAPDEMRGRISGLNQINLGGTMAVFNLVNGFLVDYLGVSTLMTILGVGFAAIVVVSILIGALRQVYLHGVPTAARGLPPRGPRRRPRPLARHGRRRIHPPHAGAHRGEHRRRHVTLELDHEHKDRGRSLLHRRKAPRRHGRDALDPPGLAACSSSTPSSASKKPQSRPRGVHAVSAEELGGTNRMLHLQQPHAWRAGCQAWP